MTVERLPQAGYFSDEPNKPLAEDEFFATLLIPAKTCFPHTHSWIYWQPSREAGWALKICNCCGLFRLYDPLSPLLYDRWLSEDLLSKLNVMDEFAIRWHQVGFDSLSFYLPPNVANFTIYHKSKVKENVQCNTYFLYKKRIKKKEQK